MQTLDYRQTSWGHNFYSDKASEGEPYDYTALVWFRKRVSEGDNLLWRTEYGYCRLEIVGVHWYGDPRDMYKLQLKVIGRYDDDDNKLD